MAGHIDFKAKSDRELLVLAAQTINIISEQKLPVIERRIDTLRCLVDNHADRLMRIETNCKLHAQRSYRKLTALVAGITTGLCSSLYLAGSLMHWW